MLIRIDNIEQYLNASGLSNPLAIKKTLEELLLEGKTREQAWRVRGIALYHLCEFVHGSGINGEWAYDVSRRFFVCSNFFEPIDEHGFYDGYAHFSVYFPRTKDLREFRLHFNGRRSQALARKYDLRYYIEETIAQALLG